MKTPANRLSPKEQAALEIANTINLYHAPKKVSLAQTEHWIGSDTDLSTVKGYLTEIQQTRGLEGIQPDDITDLWDENEHQPLLYLDIHSVESERTEAHSGKIRLTEALKAEIIQCQQIINKAELCTISKTCNKVMFSREVLEVGERSTKEEIKEFDEEFNNNPISMGTVELLVNSNYFWIRAESKNLDADGVPHESYRFPINEIHFALHDSSLFADCY